MKLRRRLAPVIVAFGALAQGAVVVCVAETNVVQFTQPAPYSSDEELGRRFGYGVLPPGYDISGERFRVEVPPTGPTNTTFGLLVWLSPGDDAVFPPVWQDELARHEFILVLPLNSGDERNPADRLRLALDATCNACRKYRIDRKRIYIGGYAGGARLASMLGIACSDIFTGTLCVGGVGFHLHVVVSGNQYYPGSFYPNPQLVEQARTKEGFVLITGEGDPNFELIKVVAEKGFRRDGFKRVLLLQAPGIGQTPPEPGTLNQALVFLEKGDIPTSQPLTRK
jgi:hypothetical protein